MSNVSLAAVAAKLGLPADATGQQILAAVDRRIAGHRDKLVAEALRAGKITEESAPRWRACLDQHPAETEKLLAKLQPALATSAPRAAEPTGDARAAAAAHQAVMRAFGVTPREAPTPVDPVRAAFGLRDEQR